MKNFSILNKSRSKLPDLPLFDVKENILGKDYELSLVFSNKKLAAELHKKWKKEDGQANILSFPISNNEGEIFISPDKAKEEYENFDMTFPNYLIFLFIHGCLHLKGLKHSDIMESEEKRIFELFKRS